MSFFEFLDRTGGFYYEASPPALYHQRSPPSTTHCVTNDIDQHSVGEMRPCTPSPLPYFCRVTPFISLMKSGMSTRRSRIVLSTGSAGLTAGARATQQVVSTMMVIPVYGDGTTYDQ